MRRLFKIFGVRRTIGSMLLPLLILLRIWDPAPVEGIRLQTFDFYQVLKPRPATTAPIVIIDIDEDSLRELGQWPWPRTIVAELVAKAHGLGAVAVAFDVLFPEPDRMSPSIAADSFRDLDADTRQKLRGLPSNDDVFADVIRQSRVILGQSGSVVLGKLDPNRPQTGFAIRGPDPSEDLVSFPGLLTNIPVLEQAAAGRGLFSIRPERDGIVRRVPIVLSAQGTIVPSLTLEMLRVVTGSGAILIKSDEAGVQSVAVPGLELPTDRNGQVWVHFSRHNPARYVSAKDILQGKAAPEKLTGKLAIVGTSAIGLLDVKTTPTDASIPGVEVHAQLLENALTKSLLSYPNYAIVMELATAILFGGLIIALAPMVGATTLFGLGLAVAVAITGMSWFFYTQKSVLLDFTFPLLSSLLIYLTLVFISYFREQRERKRIRSAFSQYISPALVEQLVKSPGKLKLGGEERDMTIMFSDVRGFTTISESYKHDPQGLTRLMNRFLTPLTNAIIDKNGTIDKYMGDAIMAFWNAPLDDDAHEINACKAALEMLRRVDLLNAEREEESKTNAHVFVPIKIGVGLNTGTCVVGNMGSDLRFDYSVLGDSVNLASRLEGRSKSYGLPIIAGAKTAHKAMDKFAALEIDLITVKGKTEPEYIYTILGGEDVLNDADFQQLHELHSKMLVSYRTRDWKTALEHVQLCRFRPNNFGLGEVYNLYWARIQTFQETAPPDDWDGVFAFDTK
jgi:adenylate cyclase